MGRIVELGKVERARRWLLLAAQYGLHLHDNVQLRFGVLPSMLFATPTPSSQVVERLVGRKLVIHGVTERHGHLAVEIAPVWVKKQGTTTYLVWPRYIEPWRDF
jgi:hypothetical protein